MASMSSSASSAWAASGLVAGVEHGPHALEVLVDPDGHHLDLQPELVELGGEAGAHGRSAHPNRPVT